MPTPERVVINSGPLLALHRGGVLDLLHALDYEFVTTPEVVAELEAGVERGHSRVRLGQLPVMPLKAPYHASLALELGAGEASVIQVAMEQEIRWVCIDELAGRFKAAALELEVVGTLGLLMRAKRLGLIPAVDPVIQRMWSGGSWFDAGLVARLLISIGEQHQDPS